MAFSNITFKHTNGGVDTALHTLVEQKFAGLGKYLKGDREARAEVEFERILSHQSGPVCRIEANLWVNGTLYRAQSTQNSFEAAIDAVRSELDYELRKANTKRTSLIRRGSRKLKEMMRFGKE